MILVTGGAGFIGSNFILNWLAENDEQVLNVDKLTYAGNLQNLQCLREDPRYIFARVDICDTAGIETLLSLHRPRAVLNFAAESHVDRSIASPDQFVRTNVTGTFSLLEAVRGYWSTLRGEEGADFRFLQVSTDEVYGSLGPQDPPFTEATPYAPNSPYAATKAAADHLVRAWHHTYGLPTLTTNCSNNYGPYHFPEKLIPLMITNALGGQALPVYGDGLQVRDWLYVTDHCMALTQVLHAGEVGQVYNIGGRNEKTNLDVVTAICTLLDQLSPRRDGKSYCDQITLVKDRPGHDRRYAIDAGKIERELGFTPLESFESGLRKTVEWYLDNPDWVRNVKSGDYRHWVGGRA